jgi:hypothetical protein
VHKQRLTWCWWVSEGGATRHCWGGVIGAAVAGSGGGKGEQPRQWWVCHVIVGVAALQHLHGGIVGAGEGRRACCDVGEAAVGPQSWRGMTEVAGVTLHCWCVGSIVVKIVLLHYHLLLSQPHPLQQCVFFHTETLRD